MVHVDHEIQYIGIYFSTDWRFEIFKRGKDIALDKCTLQDSFPYAY